MEKEKCKVVEILPVFSARFGAVSGYTEQPCFKPWAYELMIL